MLLHVFLFIFAVKLVVHNEESRGSEIHAFILQMRMIHSNNPEEMVTTPQGVWDVGQDQVSGV